ncbi:MAG: hypothetical protein IJF92_04215 [Bacilli bacterium]|nr:hypothetical protein [Bacilli bacterium]
MNYELKYNDNGFISSITEPRRIKLRKLSFGNVFNAWNSFINNNIEDDFNQNDSEIKTDFIPNNKVFETSIKRMDVNISNLDDEIMMIDNDYGYVRSIKRRVLAISKDMYDGIITNVFNIYESNISNVNTKVDEDEIRQAVKDAFDQIEFDEPTNEDIVITPEEVSNTVVSYDDQNDTEDLEKDFNNNEFDSNSYIEDDINPQEEDVQDDFDTPEDNNEDMTKELESDEYNDKQPLFNFEDINFDSIDIEDEKQIEDDSYEENNFELNDIIAQAKELKAKKDEQDKKTEAAKNLALAKEKEKEKIKEEFVSYKRDIEEELNKSKQLEQENLERARKAEEFSEALSSIME